MRLTVGNDKPWFAQTVTVKSDIDNPDWIMVKFVDSNGTVITSSSNGIIPGGSDTFYISSGTKYKIQVKAGSSGTYELDIYD